ncbi:MarR family winged helix-turn-helix transcriptional regulator [Paraburkholderia aspalathi]|uniref:Transcriptional regulator, MarR family n=1 Tax=Paraburkholderia aspalathi TaxID=1324617 RepID=A0A1I7EJG1_9BURK|nr:MarR family winged helix-turn-helix transcriptional regulator [Paraburkholderia aspalathi]SFU24073.1 transcriptional regulator, MarR family [Paraburkholderia aspalathi]
MGTRNRSKDAGLTKRELEELSEFRYRLRRFLHFSETIVHAEGITPLQYMLLLHVKGFPDRDWATVGELAERLQASPHGTVALVSRCEAVGLVKRKPSAQDRRQVEVHLLAKGERCLTKLAVLHKSEIQSFGWAFRNSADSA